MNNELAAEFRNQAIFRLHEKRDHLAKCFSLLTEEDMWWRPNDNSNSVGNIVLHLCGNIGQYIIASLGEQADTRDRDREFSTREGNDKAALLIQITAIINEAAQIVDNAPTAALLQERMVQGFRFSGLGVVLHAVEHLSYHVGQIAYLTKLRKDRQVGLYDDFDLNAKNE